MRVNIVNPDINKLGYVIAIANISDKHDRSTPSDYHWKILKCRMIIFSNSSILSCPDKRDVKQVHIIFNKAGDNYDKLNSLFVKFSLVQDGGIKSVSTEMYQKCFHYTMTARIAPVWNTLEDNYLINNRDFLTAKGLQDGLKYNVSVNDIYTVIEMNGVKINLMISEEEFLPGEWIRVLPSINMEEMSAPKTGPARACACQGCGICSKELPRPWNTKSTRRNTDGFYLNKAIIEESVKDFPQTSKFKSYKDLRRHWKNIHGYRLPEEESSYYLIQFWRGEPLLYPKLCVIRNFPIVTPTPKPIEKVIISRFLNCLNSKMSNVLGTPLKIQIQDIHHENEDLIVPYNSPSETQAVSLCTPTPVAIPGTQSYVGSRL